MRNFRMKKRTKPIFVTKAAFVNVLLFTGVAVFLAVAVLAGKAVSTGMLEKENENKNSSVTVNKSKDDDVNPAPDSTPEASADTTENTVRLMFDAQNYYVIQLGAFSGEANANKCASSIRASGGAGFVREQEGKYYVYAMCYADSEDARTVSANLKAEGRSALVKCFKTASLALDISGSEKCVADIESAMRGIEEVPAELEKLIFSFDRGECERTALKTSLMKVLEDVETYRDVFGLYREQSAFFAQSENYCKGVYDDIASVLKADDDTALSAELKHIYINTVFNFIEYLDNADVG